MTPPMPKRKYPRTCAECGKVEELRGDPDWQGCRWTSWQPNERGVCPECDYQLSMDRVHSRRETGQLNPFTRSTRRHKNAD